MKKLAKFLGYTQKFFQFGSVIIGTAVSALAAMQLGGDVATSATIGGAVVAGVNGLANYVSPLA